MRPWHICAICGFMFQDIFSPTVKKQEIVCDHCRGLRPLYELPDAPPPAG